MRGLVMVTASIAPAFRFAERFQEREGTSLDQAKEMDAFLASVERSAYRIAQMAIRDQDEALDLVQDAMIRLVRRYAGRPAEEWRPLFYRILHNRIRDWQRRSVVQGRVMSWFSGSRDDGYDVIAEAPDPMGDEPERAAVRNDAMEALEVALGALPARQREAFVLRSLESLNVAETAKAMGCSEGSVKTHYSRAVHRLREVLGDHWS